MNLTVFGATGRTGLEVVRQALDAGHHVTAYVRTPSKLTVQNDQLRVVQGVLTDADSVRDAVRGADAVISVLGSTSNRPGKPLSEGVSIIVDAMQREDVTRLVVATGAGVPDSSDDPKLVHRLIGILLGLLARHVLEDSIGMVEAVRNSRLDWVIVRAPRLNDKPATGIVKAGYLGRGVGIQLTRVDFATFLLEQVREESWLRKAPVVSN